MTVHCVKYVITVTFLTPNFIKSLNGRYWTLVLRCHNAILSTEGIYVVKLLIFYE